LVGLMDVGWDDAAGDSIHWFTCQKLLHCVKVSWKVRFNGDEIDKIRPALYRLAKKAQHVI